MPEKTVEIVRRIYGLYGTLLFHLWTFCGGRVVRLESTPDRAEALEAAGLSE
jgi:hypothetical protein